MRLFVRAALGLLLLVPMATMAEDAIPASPIAKAQLLVNAPTISARKPLTAAVHFTLPEHWHIYWQNPGDSGITTTLIWTLPAGLSAGSTEWPAPERLETQGLINYGYSNEVTLLVQITPTKNSIAGEVGLKANWLVCKDICIPESVELSAPLAANGNAAEVIAAAKKMIPQPFVGKAVFSISKANVTLTFTRDDAWGDVNDVRFSPIEDGVAANNPAPQVKVDGSTLTLTFARGIADPVTTLHGVLSYTQAGKAFAWDITAEGTANIPSSVVSNAPTPTSSPSPAPLTPSLLLALALAFMGGLLLNVMPCVLPVLALKALSLAKKAESSRIAAAKQGVSFTLGVIVSFLAVAGIMLALKASGEAIGWGFQLQNAWFVGFLALIMLLVAANLLGLFELPVLFGERSTGVDDSQLSGSFLTGVLAVMVATPCLAPFMATAIGATLSMPTAQALLVFAVLGLGMAAPFLIISLWPAARRLLPKPGVWMLRVKHVLALPMLATAVWLLWVLVQLMHPAGFNASAGREAYSATRLEALRKQGTPVLVDATAAWCLSCKVNERVALHPAEMQAFLREKNITLMVADWTMSDPAITAYLASFDRNGVPLYVYYPPRGEPVILPQLLTPSLVKAAITDAHD